ncbi:MAG: DUF928 domain-containing protein [Phormidesmis sp. RL_2_1]|nr:DUF928 domain-containing protein [Phormidesmis sp. RL_2_1]
MTLPSLLIAVTLLSSFPAQAQENLPVEARPVASFRDTLVFAAPPPPPNLGAPGQRSDGAGSRGCGHVAQAPAATTAPLTALIPLYESPDTTLAFAKTSAERPTLWIYVPYQPPNIARFILQTSAGETVYQTDVELPEAPGVIGLALPDTVPPLAAAESYHWFFNVYCQSPPPLAYVEGWIQREALSSEAAAQLAQLSPPEQANFYAANGLWHDALTTAAALRQSHASDSSWNDLLQSVGLQDLAVEPIVDF